VIVLLNFAGWFQCRLATDPDPADEPRGVSGYVRALAGEPDLDRVIRLQPVDTVQRRFCPEVGVIVESVVVDGQEMPGHPLVGAAVDLLDRPVFEGRNGIVAEDGFEPIVPLHLELSQGGFRLRRRHLDEEEFPFRELQATGVQPGLTDVAEATGIPDLWPVWQRRKVQVDQALAAATDEVTRTALGVRSRMLANRRLTAFFPARMLYSMALSGAGECTDPEGFLPGAADPAPPPWLLDFWLGGWDPDALNGYLKGSLRVELATREALPLLQPGESTAGVAFAPAGRPPRRPMRP
jgi:hypothetical protein